MVVALGANFDKLRKASEVIQVYPFSSAQKRMSTVVKNGSENRIYTKVRLQFLKNNPSKAICCREPLKSF